MWAVDYTPRTGFGEPRTTFSPAKLRRAIFSLMRMGLQPRPKRFDFMLLPKLQLG